LREGRHDLDVVFLAMSIPSAPSDSIPPQDTPPLLLVELPKEVTGRIIVLLEIQRLSWK